MLTVYGKGGEADGKGRRWAGGKHEVDGDGL